MDAWYIGTSLLFLALSYGLLAGCVRLGVRT